MEDWVRAGHEWGSGVVSWLLGGQGAEARASAGCTQEAELVDGLLSPSTLLLVDLRLIPVLQLLAAAQQTVHGSYRCHG